MCMEEQSLFWNQKNFYLAKSLVWKSLSLTTIGVGVDCTADEDKISTGDCQKSDWKTVKSIPSRVRYATFVRAKKKKNKIK